MECCSLAQNLHDHIFFQIFRAWEGPVWIESSLNEFELDLKSLEII
jgi:hypothetical protein